MHTHRADMDHISSLAMIHRTGVTAGIDEQTPHAVSGLQQLQDTAFVDPAMQDGVGWKKRPNKWNLFQHQQAQDQVSSFSMPTAQAKYNTMSLADTSALKRDCKFVAEFASGRKRSTQCRFGKTTRQRMNDMKRQRLVALVAEQENLPHISVSKDVPARSTLSMIAGTALVNPLHGALEAVENECRLRIRAQSIVNMRRKRMVVAAVEDWRSDRGSHSKKALARLAPSLKPILKNLRPMPSGTHHVRSDLSFHLV